MPLVRRIAAFAFLAVWLPAMLHCRLEAAGILFESDCCDSAPRAAAPAADHGCADDLCDVAEGVFTRPDDSSARAPHLSIESSWGDRAAEVEMAGWALTGEVTVATRPPPDLSRPWAWRMRGTTTPQAP